MRSILTMIAVAALGGAAMAQETGTTGSADTGVRGVIRALTEATVAVDYTARVAKLPVLEGQFFKQGQVLVVFDCRRNNADVAAASAATRAQELVVSNNKKLLSRGAIGANEVEIAVAELEKLRQETKAVRARTGSCDFRAPFSGRMVERIVAEHETPAPNTPLIKIVDTTRLEVEAIIPSKWLSWVKPGEPFTFKVDETGEELSAKIVRVGATVDPASQTIQAFGVLSRPGQTVLPGMSGTATFAQSGS